MKQPSSFVDPYIGAHIRLHRLLCRAMVMRYGDGQEVEWRLDRDEPMANETFHAVATTQNRKPFNVRAKDGSIITTELRVVTDTVRDHGDFYTCMVRNQAREAKLPERRFMDYTVDELNTLASHVVGKICALAQQQPHTKAIAPHYPAGWQTALEETCEIDGQLPKHEIAAIAGC